MGYRLHSEIRDVVNSYVAEKRELASFEDWLWPMMADLEDSHDEEAVSVVGRIGNLISEYSDGYMTEAELREELTTAIRSFANPVASVCSVVVVHQRDAMNPIHSEEIFRWREGNRGQAGNGNAPELTWGTVGGSNSTVDPIPPQPERVSAFGAAASTPAVFLTAQS